MNRFQGQVQVFDFYFVGYVSPYQLMWQYINKIANHWAPHTQTLSSDENWLIAQLNLFVNM